MAYKTITEDNLLQLVEESDMLVIDFWAEWCGPCKVFGPVFEKVADAFPDVTFAKCNTEEQREVAGAFEVRSIPTLAIFREGVLLFKEAGAFPEPLLKEVVEKIQGLDMAEVRAELKKAQAAEEAAKTEPD